jgi:RNA polymerase sigma factor (sigma-70 family)
MATAPIGTALRQIQVLFAEGRLASLPDGELLERFLSERDEAAFTALVERHGPMVLGTCRAVLRDTNAAEDAFQATFLVLVCKARSIRGRGALASWLYQVAHRVARQAGAKAARLRTRERLVGRFKVTDGHHEIPDDDWREILHEEVARLSDKHRLPLLLCDLEGKTHAQAATELNCGEATIRRRLTGARERLRSRLIRRGVSLTAGMLAATLSRSALAKVPSAWTEAAAKAAVGMSSNAARIAVDEIVSTTAAALARKSLHAMLLSQLRVAAASVVFLIAFVGMAWGIGTYGQEKAEVRQSARMQNPRSTPEALPALAKTEKPADPHAPVTYRGRVLNADGRPFPGAALYLNPHEFQHPFHSPVRFTSGPDGRFQFEVPKSDFDMSYWETPWKGMRAPVLAQADGYAFGLANYRDDTEELTLQLARDDVPISGRIIDLQGQPVVGATVSVLQVRLPAGGSLDGWLKDLQDKKVFYGFESNFFSVGLWTQTDPPFIPPVKTGADGRFHITGIGRERAASLEIQGKTIETVDVVVRTRPGATIRVSGSEGASADDLISIYGATFEHAAGPTRPIEGVVRDIDTGKPLAGIMVRSQRSLGRPDRYVRAVTDVQGRYRLVGLPRGREGHVRATAPVDFPLRGYGDCKDEPPGPRNEDLPYLPAGMKVGEPGGVGPITLDINLKRGIWLTGRVIEGDTGKPVLALVEYYVFQDNPHQEGYPAFQETLPNYHYTGRDGEFQFVAFPGPGLLVADGDTSRNAYTLGAGADALKHKAKKYKYLETYPNGIVPSERHVLAEIDPAPEAVSLKQDLLLQRGRSLTVTVLGPDRKPLAGNQAAGLSDGIVDYIWEKGLAQDASSFTILGLRPGKPRTVTVLNPKQRLTGQLVLRGDESQPQTITLQPWGVLTGRIVDDQGEPCNVGDVLLGARVPFMEPRIPKDGRFRIEGLVPGKPYKLELIKGSMLVNLVVEDVKVGPGEVKDLGDIVPRPPRGL